MRLIELCDGALELRWTWLPYWMVASPSLQAEVEAVMRDVVLLNAMTKDDESLDRIEQFVIRLLTRRFPFLHLDKYLSGLRQVVQETS